MRRVFGQLAGVMALFAIGCGTTTSHDLRQPHVEEFNPPPEEARYSNPPEDKYRKPQTIKDQAGQLGSGGSLGGFDPSNMGGMNGGAGMGGRR